MRRRRQVSVGLVAGLALAGEPAPSAAQGSSDPIPQRIPKSGLAAEIVDVVGIPASSAERPLARINLLTHAGDGSERLFVNDMRGKIYAIAPGGGLSVFLDVAAALGDGNLDTLGSQTGVSTFAFHPDFATPGAPGFGKFYTAHMEVLGTGTPDFPSPTGTATHHDVLAEWSLDPADPSRIDPASKREILRIAQPTRDHNLGQIGFDSNASPGDPDRGILYVAVGDGGYPVGSPADPNRTAQDRTDVFGSILRIDPLGTSTPERPTNGHYGIPADNPFVGAGDGSLGEIWAYGLRNPHRFSWDTGGGHALLISDIGQNQIEEIELGRTGANYGWSEREGTFVFDPSSPNLLFPLPPDDASLGFTYPVAQYDHDEGNAVVGGFVYRGSLLPSLYGHYVFGDLVNGRIFHVEAADLVDGSQAAIEELTLLRDGVETTLLALLGNDFRADLRFGIDEAGEIYVLTKRDGMVRMLVPEPASGALLLAGACGLALLAAARRRSRRPWGGSRRDLAPGGCGPLPSGSPPRP
jgi:hypothetical protein